MLNFPLAHGMGRSQTQNSKFQASEELAKLYLNNAINNLSLRSTSEDLYQEISLLKAAFQNGTQLILDPCDSAPTKNLIAYTHAHAMDPVQDWYFFRKGEKKVNKIYICVSAIGRSKEVLAQNLIHEVSHLALQTSEQEATGLEIAAVYFGGGAPFLNGYTYYGKTWKFEGVKSVLGMSNAETAALRLEWLKFPGFVDSPFRYEMNQLRSDVIFGVATDEILDILNVYKDRIEEVTHFRDNQGMTLLMIAAREGHLSVFKSLLSAGGTELLKDKNNFDQDVAAIAREYKRDDITKYISSISSRESRQYDNSPQARRHDIN